MQTIKATSFRDATAEDWELATRLGRQQMLGDAGRRAIQLLKSQKDADKHGWQVNNYEHTLECATKALRAGESEEYVVAALLHDVGQDLNPYSHDKIAGDVLRHYVSEELHWVVANHQIFQLSFRDHSKFDTKAVEKFRGHPHFQAAMRFCERYDMDCFDGSYDWLPIEAFEPMVYRLFETGVRAFHAKYPYPYAASQAAD
ncbi:MAG: HD domain-containing protein [Proteobacteria bacterium]|nr:HD domain-containing protein [Pseudomonadota bacterium]MBI3495894.1 HD domain-containing protein [Pseudomonadota bacterium]